MIAMPDPDTYTVLPWRTHGDKGNVARMFCDVLKPGGEPYEGDPRFVMRRALARAKDMGFDTFNLGPELEFFYFGVRRPPRGRRARRSSTRAATSTSRRSTPRPTCGATPSTH